MMTEIVFHFHCHFNIAKSISKDTNELMMEDLRSLIRRSITEKIIDLKGTESPFINPNTFTFSMSEIIDFGVHFFNCIFDPDHGIGNTMQKV